MLLCKATTLGTVPSLRWHVKTTLAIVYITGGTAFAQAISVTSYSRLVSDERLWTRGKGKISGSVVARRNDI